MAEPGFEPGSIGHEPIKEPFLYSALIMPREFKCLSSFTDILRFTVEPFNFL